MNSFALRSLCLAVVISCSFGGVAIAQESSAATSKPDASFVKQASAAGLAEIALGRLAAEKGASADVKTFGQTMVDDHTKAGDELRTIATGKSLAVSAAPTPADVKAATLIGNENGTAFDKAFKAKMVADHEKVITLFRTESTSGKDSDLKAFATKTLPTLQHHLEMAKQLPADR